MDRTSEHHELQHALAYAENIIATLREPFVVLDKSLRVRTANAAFYRDFHVSKEETEGRFVYDLGNGQWDIPQLRTLLPQVLSNSHPVEDFEVEHAFPALGRRNMLLNARRFPPESDDPDLVLLAIEDITDRRRAEAAMKHSEVRYRRLFQKAKDGILILDADTGKVIDANPFMTALLGYSHDEFLGKELWEIGLFRDIEESRAAYRELQEKGYVRYENLPLESRSGQKVEVEFVSNVYAENHHQVVQCNIRDITERSRLQRLTQEQAAALADLDRRKDEFLAMLSAMNFATPSPPSSMPPFSCACTATGIVCTASRTRSSSNPPASLSVRWDNWHGSLMNCSKSLALPQAGFSFTKNGSPWASSWKMRWRRSAR